MAPVYALALRGSHDMPIDPPDNDRPPEWAQVLVRAANARNRIRESEETYLADLPIQPFLKTETLKRAASWASLSNHRQG